MDFGGKDILMAKMKRDEWSEPINLEIKYKYDELSLFIHVDGAL